MCDSYGGYNGVDAVIQRCWVHFVRDLDKLVKDNPGDEGVAKWVRQNHPHIVVIVLTNLADDEAARDLGGDITFLRKPEVLPFELAAQLRQRLAERGD